MEEQARPNKYLELLEQLEAECKAGKTASCFTSSDPAASPGSGSIVQDPLLWGVFVTAWVVIAIPAYFAETAAVSGTVQQSTAESSVRERRFTKLGLWWSFGLVLLLAMWKLGASAIFAATVMVLFVLLSVASRYLYAPRVRDFLRSFFSRRHVRIGITAVALWLLVVQSLGFVFGWHEHLSGARFAALHGFPVLLAGVAYACVRWIRNAK